MSLNINSLRIKFSLLKVSCFPNSDFAFTEDVTNSDILVNIYVHIQIYVW